MANLTYQPLLLDDDEGAVAERVATAYTALVDDGHIVESDGAVQYTPFDLGLGAGNSYTSMDAPPAAAPANSYTSMDAQPPTNSYTSMDAPTVVAPSGDAFATALHNENNTGFVLPTGDSFKSNAATPTASVDSISSVPTTVNTDSVSSMAEGVRNWNEEYQQILSLGRHQAEERTQRLKTLSEEFTIVSQEIAKTIIDELRLPVEERTIPSVNVGGIAGGDKYFLQGILFKFAKDSRGIYGGDENAMRAASHELRGLQALVGCGIPNLHMPLMAVVDYHGFRVVALSLLPIDPPGSLAFGSADGGVTLKDSCPELSFKMLEAGSMLNLKRHKVCAISAQRGGCPPGTVPEMVVSLGADVEGHVGTDGRYYILDTARLFPPATPDKSVKGGHLFQMLRPELVARYGKPLSSDAFSFWGRDNFRVHNTEVRDATNYLLECVIPTFARALDACVREFVGDDAAVADNTQGDSIGDIDEEWIGVALALSELRADSVGMLNELKAEVKSIVDGRGASSGLSIDVPFDALDGAVLSEIMHSWGINLRYMGIVREHTKTKEARSLLLGEMIARVVKNMVRASMRQTADKPREELKLAVVTQMNIVLGNSDASREWWSETVRSLLITKYTGSLTDEEFDASYNLRGDVDLKQLFSRIQDSTGVRFSADVNALVSDDAVTVFGSTQPFSDEDFVDVVIEPAKSVMGASVLVNAQYANTIATARNAFEVAHLDREQAYMQFYSMLAPSLRELTLDYPRDGDVWYYMGRTQKDLANDVDLARDALERAVMLNPGNADAAYALGILYLDFFPDQSAEGLALISKNAHALGVRATFGEGRSLWEYNGKSMVSTAQGNVSLTFESSTVIKLSCIHQTYRYVITNQGAEGLRVAPDETTKRLEADKFNVPKTTLLYANEGFRSHGTFGPEATSHDVGKRGSSWIRKGPAAKKPSAMPGGHSASRLGGFGGAGGARGGFGAGPSVLGRGGPGGMTPFNPHAQFQKQAAAAASVRQFEYSVRGDIPRVLKLLAAEFDANNRDFV